jgi:hypothetical protein
MDFYEVPDQVLDLLRQRGRVAYRVLKLQFKLDDEALEALKDELIYSQRLAVDAEGKVLVWTGEPVATSCEPHKYQRVGDNSQNAPRASGFSTW